MRDPLRRSEFFRLARDERKAGLDKAEAFDVEGAIDELRRLRTGPVHIVVGLAIVLRDDAPKPRIVVRPRGRRKRSQSRSEFCNMLAVAGKTVDDDDGALTLSNSPQFGSQPAIPVRRKGG